MNALLDVCHPDCQTCANRIRDTKRVQAELRDRINRLNDLDPAWLVDALRWLAQYGHADLVNEALDETGAPE